MIFRILNVILLSIVMVSAFMLITKRYETRIDYETLSQMQHHAENLEKEYTRLQLEAGTYSSNLVLQDFALKRLGLTLPDKNHVVEVK